MHILMSCIRAFIVGGLICCIGQILIDKTKLTPAKILVIFVTSGGILGALGIYEKLIEFGGAGATIPLTGFGYSLIKGVFIDVNRYGLIGVFTGGVRAAAAGITAAVFFGYFAAVVFKPKPKIKINRKIDEIV